MRVIFSLARIGAAVFGLTAASCKEVKSPGSTMSPPSLDANTAPRPPGISIRQAFAEEAHPLLTNMINGAFQHYHARCAKDLETAERVTSDGKQVASMMETPCNAFLVAEEVKDDASKSVVGCVHVCWSGETHSKDEDVDAQFGMLSVLKECSGRGIGKLLVSAAEERCRKELGRENIVVEISVVSFFPELFGWYEAQGYRKKRTVPFPMPELIRDDCDFELQLMTKTIP